jgi:hypothetical protein
MAVHIKAAPNRWLDRCIKYPTASPAHALTYLVTVIELPRGGLMACTNLTVAQANALADYDPNALAECYEVVEHIGRECGNLIDVSEYLQSKRWSFCVEVHEARQDTPEPTQDRNTQDDEEAQPYGGDGSLTEERIAQGPKTEVWHEETITESQTATDTAVQQLQYRHGTRLQRRQSDLQACIDQLHSRLFFLHERETAVMQIIKDKTEEAAKHLESEQLHFVMLDMNELQRMAQDIKLALQEYLTTLDALTIMEGHFHKFYEG